MSTPDVSRPVQARRDPWRLWSLAGAIASALAIAYNVIILFDLVPVTPGGLIGIAGVVWVLVLCIWELILTRPGGVESIKLGPSEISGIGPEATVVRTKDPGVVTVSRLPFGRRALLIAGLGCFALALLSTVVLLVGRHNPTIRQFAWTGEAFIVLGLMVSTVMAPPGSRRREELRPGAPALIFGPEGARMGAETAPLIPWQDLRASIAPGDTPRSPRRLSLRSETVRCYVPLTALDASVDDLGRAIAYASDGRCQLATV